jgi:hypothetical protein
VVNSSGGAIFCAVMVFGSVHCDGVVDCDASVIVHGVGSAVHVNSVDWYGVD